MSGQSSKECEKQYLARTGSHEWEHAKPFPAGTAYSPESIDLIWEFVVVLKNLCPSANDVILDLGAGSCWLTEWMQRLNLHPISVDISLDMLRIGKSRLPQNPLLLAGDLESLPVKSETIDKVISFNAIHHVPKIDQALGEIRRVLKEDGVAIFSEPGIGHSQYPPSRIASRDFGVLEQDIVIADFMKACSDVGFADVQLKPTSYVLPYFGLTRDEWRSWERFKLRKRPLRSLQKLYRLFLEFIGAGKKDFLLEETFAIFFIRHLKQVVEEHPIIMAYKSPPKQYTGGAKYLAKIKILKASQTVEASALIDLMIRIENTGNAVWPSVPTHSSSHVQLGVQLLDQDFNVIDRDYFRHPLFQPVSPKETQELRCSVPAPAQPGKYFLRLDMVLEGVAWFELQGSMSVVHPLEVLPHNSA